MYKYLILLPLVLSSCAGAEQGVRGGVLMPYMQVPNKPDQTYTGGPCHTRDGTPAQDSTDVEYELRRAQASATLFEHSLNEKEGRLIKNQWEDPGALHFFVWLADVRGFEYVVPKNQKDAALRRVYSHPQVRTVKRSGRSAVQPVGDPDIVCELILR